MKIDYLGHAIRPDNFEIINPTNAARRELKNTRDETESRFVFPLFIIIRYFVPIFGCVSAPFYNRFLEDDPTQFQKLLGTKKDNVEQVEGRLANPPILALLQADRY